MSTAIELIRDATNGGRALSLADLARAINLSPSRLRHLFKADTGFSPAHYQRTLQMERARTLLETTFLTVKQVMNGVGVNDESHFVRDFKQMFGCSPSRHRAHVWARHDTRPSARALASDDTAGAYGRSVRRAGVRQ